MTSSNCNKDLCTIDLCCKIWKEECSKSSLNKRLTEKRVRISWRLSLALVKMLWCFTQSRRNFSKWPSRRSKFSFRFTSTSIWLWTQIILFNKQSEYWGAMNTRQWWKVKLPNLSLDRLRKWKKSTTFTSRRTIKKWSKVLIENWKHQHTSVITLPSRM